MPRSRLHFPDSPKNVLDCADWLELIALISPEKDSSIAEIERNLKRLSAYQGTGRSNVQQDSSIEGACAEVLAELRRRAKAAGPAYPFRIDNTRLLLKGGVDNYPEYVFCLCLSWFGWTPRKGRKVFPRRMFEDLSKHAAAAFVGGTALRFGAPRSDDLPSAFKDALAQLCVRMGEGEIRSIVDPVTAQDDSLDLVAWRDFPDRSEGKIFLLGQCASGDNWESKKRELDANAFFDDWFTDIPPSRKSTCVGFFIPHRVPQNKWVKITRRAGIIFDRCRIAYWSRRAGSWDASIYVEWSTKTLATVRA